MIGIDKINVWAIVVGHWGTLKDGATGSRWPDVGIFVGVPLVVTAGLASSGVLLEGGAIQVLTNAFAIMAGLLFNLLVVLQSLAAAARPRNDRIRRFTREVYDNISYAILVSLVALIPLTIASNYGSREAIGFRLSGWMAIALVGHFTLTLFMVLKRMHRLLRDEFSE